MGDRRWYTRQSKEDQTQQISKSIFVTNFPDHFTFRDLWSVCDEYGKVVDVYIPNRKSKAGSRFAFVRYIKVVDVDRLVENLCTVWIGRLRLHANIVRFQRPSASTNNKPKVMPVGNQMGSYASTGADLHVRQGKIEPTVVDNTMPSLVFDDACIRETDRVCSVTGKVKEFGSIHNLYILLAKEGFSILTISYLGGLWVLIELNSVDAKNKFLKHVGVGSWFTTLNHANPKFISEERIVWVDTEGIPLHARTKNTFMRIGSKWGEVLKMEDLVESALYQKRLCIKTKLTSIIFESFKVIVQGKMYWARAKEMYGWNPAFRKE
nr:RNA-directed DNA polymerase, eukaryota, nucleotide-binding alpha-beta plait domain protein [Tanacetum cinerariifolium]